MRTKSLLVAAAILAAGVSASLAQSNVYSLNVVGYVNKTYQGGFFVMAANPLKNQTNSLKNIFPNPPDGTSIFRWNVGLQDLDGTIPTYFTGSGTWIPEATINPGEGFFVLGGANFTNTYVGEVMQGALTNALAGNGAFQAIGAMVPVGGAVSNVLAQYPAGDGDSVFTWNVPAQDLDGTIPTYFTGANKWIPDGNIAVADGFFLLRNGGPVNYVRNFTVQ